MAIAAQGFTVTFNSVNLGEVREIEIDNDRGQPLQRFGTWTLERGTVRIAAFSSAAVPENLYSLRKTLVVTAPGNTATGPVQIFSEPCVYEKRNITIEANDAVRFDFTFRIID
jgi:hypothetical protein